MNNLKLYEQYVNKVNDYNIETFVKLVYKEFDMVDDKYNFSYDGINYDMRGFDNTNRINLVPSLAYRSNARCEFLSNSDKLIDMNIFNDIGWDDISFSDLTLYIQNNPNLKNFNGFEGFKLIQKSGYSSLVIRNNNNLESLKGMKDIDMSRSTLYIINNPNLKSLEGIDEIKGLGYIYLKDNPYILDATIPPDLDVYEIESFHIHTEHLDGEFLDTVYDELINQLEYELDNCQRSKWDIEQILKRFKGDSNFKDVIKILDQGGYNLDDFNYLGIEMDKYLGMDKYKNTGARGIAKVATGRYLGMF